MDPEFQPCIKGSCTRLLCFIIKIAIETKKILVGPGITNPYVRHPGITASAIASLDEVSKGRSFVGIGAGGGLTLNPLGIERLKPATTVSETVVALRGLFSGERVSLEGCEFSLKSASLNYGRGSIEIFLAGRGERMTQLGSELGDGFCLSYIHKDFLPRHVKALRKSAKRDPFKIVYSTMIVSSQKEFEEARAALTFRLVDSPELCCRLLSCHPLMFSAWMLRMFFIYLVLS